MAKTPSAKTSAAASAAGATSKSASKTTAKTVAKAAPAAAKETPAKAAPVKSAAAKTTVKAAPVKPAPGKSTPDKGAKAAPVKSVANKSAPAKAAASHGEAGTAATTPVKKTNTFRSGFQPPPPPVGGRLDAKFLDAQLKQLLEERVNLLGQADRLEGEAASLMEDLDPGDVQFDDESGEGDTLVVERQRDLALSAQARQMVADIDAALVRIDDGTYGYSLKSGKVIPRERLKAIPWATELVEEKVGGLGSNR